MWYIDYMELFVHITPKQRKVLEFIRHKITKENIPPTIREIAGALGFSSTGTVRDYLKALEKKGYIKRGNKKSRAIALAQGSAVKIPLVSTIPAGKPDSAYEDTRDYLDLERMFSKDATHTDIFAMEVEPSCFSCLFDFFYGSFFMVVFCDHSYGGRTAGYLIWLLYNSKIDYFELVWEVCGFGEVVYQT